MKGLVFWVEGPVEVAYELWQEPLRFLCEALSETFPVWLIQSHHNDTTPAYEMKIWNGQGHEIIFWGDWKSKKIIHFVSHYWHIQGFTPAIIVKVYSEKPSMFSYWKKRFRIPLVELLHAEGMRIWPHSGFLSEPVAKRRCLVIPVDDGSRGAAYEIGSAVLERGWSVLFTGWAQAVTPFRRLHSRYPGRVAIHLGLSWMELEGLLDSCRVVVLPAPRPLVFALGWGIPVFYPGPVPWEATMAYSYNGLNELLALLERSDLSSIPQKTSYEVASEWIEWYKAISMKLPG